MDQGIELQRAGKPESIDLYEYQHRAQAVVDLIQECPRPFVIAVYGEWGRGKSTFLNMIVEQLRIQRSADSQEQEQVQPSILNPDDWTIAAYNPWHYRIDRFEDAWESLSEVVAESLSGDALIGQQVDTLRELLIKNKWMKLVLRVGWSAADLFPSGKASKKVIENLLRAPRSLGEAMARTHLLFDDMRNALFDLAKDKKVLLVVDDIDRCDPDAMAHTLRCLATLLCAGDKSPPFVILLALDRRTVTEALTRSQRWEPDYVQGYLDKIINVHVTLPILQVGTGDSSQAIRRIRKAITRGGRRAPGPIKLEGMEMPFEIPDDRLDIIARFMHYNPRELERFCTLFDLKWESRLKPNFAAESKGIEMDYSLWLARFCDRMIWEAIVELRWPLYDAKTGDIQANKEYIIAAVRGEATDGTGLPCYEFLSDLDFMNIHRLYYLDWAGADI